MITIPQLLTLLPLGEGAARAADEGVVNPYLSPGLRPFSSRKGRGLKKQIRPTWHLFFRSLNPMTEHTPQDLHYTKTHEWVKPQPDGSWLVGITDHAQQLLGDLVYVQLPTLHADVQAETEVCVVESVKAAADVYSPTTGRIVAINDALVQQPELVNREPYGQGWLFRLQPVDASTLASLMTAEAYTQSQV